MSLFPAHAQDTQPIVAETPVVVTVVDGSARLTYHASSKQRATISVQDQSPTSLDLTLAVLDPNEQLIAFNDDRDTPYGSLSETDSVLIGVELDARNYTLVIRTFSGTGSGEALVALTASPPTPDEIELATLNAGQEQVDFSVPQFNVFEYSVQVYAGQRLTISARALTQDFDPILELLDASLTVIGSNDDHNSDDPMLGERDAQIVNYEVGDTATLLARVRGYAGAGGNVELTILRESPPLDLAMPPLRAELTLEGIIETGGVFEQSFDAERGDLITIIAIPSVSSLEPRLALVDSARRPLATAERTSPTDAPVTIERYLVRIGGSFTAQLRGFRDSIGAFKLVIRHEGREVPLTLPDRMELRATVESSETFSARLVFQAGDYVSLSARSDSFGFDPYLMLIDSEGNPLQLNDDHGSDNSMLGLLDAHISHYPIHTTGSYTAEVGGYNASAGAFTLIIETLHRED